jgi:mono/diheme cytochrome c family protein
LSAIRTARWQLRQGATSFQHTQPREIEVTSPSNHAKSTVLQSLLHAAALAAGLLLAACAVEVQNTQPAKELALQSQPPGSVYMGWRVFQDRCARCHGAAATGAAVGPDLLPRVRDLGQRRFVNVVLGRYEWSLPAAQAGSETAAREALIEQLLQRKAGGLVMPAWEGEPRVQAHIVDLYAYLAARADGRQGPGRPAP